MPEGYIIEAAVAASLSPLYPYNPLPATVNIMPTELT
jgi:hypothetical protein